VNFYWKVTDTGPTDTYEIGPMGGDTYEIGSVGGDKHEIGIMGGGGGAYIVQVYQDSTVRDIDMLFVANHNFDGLSCNWQWSSDGSNWVDAVTPWVADDNDIVKAIAVAVENKYYWRFIVYGPTNPTAGEIWMGGGYSFGIQRKPSPMHIYQDNVNWSRSIGGQTRGIKLGTVKQRRDYKLSLSNGNLANYNQIVTDLNDFS
ncbi:MAG: hypothetical protein GY869_04080, partial [Planctomycetes bacterium]|nr:hypothetical protein [Planctomycetota bacterium]